MDDKQNIYEKIIAIMSEINYIQKSDKKVNNQYRFVSHDQVSAAIHPLLVKHGVVALPMMKTCTQNGNRTEMTVTVRFVNASNPSDFIESDWIGYGIDLGDKGPGKALSYAFKYAILKTFCLETGDDPDNDASSKYEPPETRSIGLLQIAKLETMLLDHPEIRSNVLSYLEKKGIPSFASIPEDMYETILKQITRKLEQVSNATTES